MEKEAANAEIAHCLAGHADKFPVENTFATPYSNPAVDGSYNGLENGDGLFWRADLRKGTMRLAELMMDTAVSSALKGKNMDEADMGEGPTAPHPMAKAEFE